MSETNERSCKSCCNNDCRVDVAVISSLKMLGIRHALASEFLGRNCKHYAEPEPSSVAVASEKAWQEHIISLDTEREHNATSEAHFKHGFYLGDKRGRKEALKDAKAALMARMRPVVDGNKSRFEAVSGTLVVKVIDELAEVE